VATAPRLEPPYSEFTLDQTGRMPHAWMMHAQNVVDQLATVQDQIAASKQGVTDGSAAAAGDIGEYLTASGSVGLSSTAYANVATVSLTAGDWDVSGSVQFTAAGGATGTNVLASVSTVSAAASGTLQEIPGAFPAGFIAVIGTGSAASLNTTAPVDVFLVARAVFSGGSVTAAGSVRARRMR
jgi:hypothetical protein